jgi:hypothetical protein
MKAKYHKLKKNYNKAIFYKNKVQKKDYRNFKKEKNL